MLLSRCLYAGLMTAALIFSLATATADDSSDLPALLDFTEWPVKSTDGRPRDPDVAPDGSVWFVGQVNDYVGQLDPQTGEIQYFDIPDAGPHMVIVDDNGIPWYAGNKDRHIGKLNPQTGEVTRFEMPEGIDDPHTLAWTDAGNIWFTAQHSGYIGHLDVTSGEVKAIKVPGDNMRPYGLVLDDNDRPYVAFMGDNAIGQVDTQSMTVKILETPDEDSIIRRIDKTSDGRIWWTDASMGHLGVYNPQTDEMRQWQTPAGEAAGLYAMTVDDQDRVWYVETAPQPNRFIGFDTHSEKFISIDEVPSGGVTVRNMMFDKARRAIWFGTDAHTIGRARVPE